MPGKKHLHARATFRDLLLSRTRSAGGFTLLELLLVIAIVVALVGIVLGAVRVQQIFTDSADAEHEHYRKQLESAMYQHLVSEWELLNDTAIPEGETNAKPICKYEVTTDGTCVNLDGLIPTYMAALPVDRRETNLNYTGYTVYKNSGRVLVVAAHLGEEVGGGGGGGGGGGLVWITPEATYGTAGGSVTVVATALDSDTFVFLRDNDIQIGSVAGNTIAWDTASQESGVDSVLASAAAALTESTFVIATGSFEGEVRAGSFGGGAITWQTPVTEVNGSQTFFPSITALDSDTFVLSYGDDGPGTIALRVGSVAGGAVSWETPEIPIPGSLTFYSEVATIDSDSFLHMYFDTTDSTTKVRVGTVDFVNDTIAWDTPATVAFGASTMFDFAMFDSDTFVSVGNNGARIGTIAGGAITWDTVLTPFTGSSVEYLGLAPIDSDTFIVSWRDAATDAGRVRIGSLGGGTITWDTEETAFSSVSTIHTFLDSFGGGTFILSYRDNDSSEAGIRVGSYQ